MADNRRRRRVFSAAVRVAAVVLAAGLAATACTDSEEAGGNSAGVTTELPSKSASGAPISIGYISPEGGANSEIPEAREAAEAAVKYVNESLGGLRGRPVNLVICKEKEDPATARNCANELVSANVVAVLAPVSGQGDAMVPIVTGAGLAYVAGQGPATSEMTTPGAFVLTSGIPGGLTIAAQYAAQQQYKKATAVVPDTGGVVGGLTMIAGPAFKQNNVELQIVPIPVGTPDTTPQMSAAIDSKPDLIMVLGDAPLCTSALKALQTLGYTGDKLVVQTCVDPAVIAAVGTAIDGAHVSSFSDVTSLDPEAVLYRSVMAKYAPKTSVDGGAFWGYQTTLGLIRAVEQALKGEPTAQSVRTALAEAKDVPLPAGRGLTFTCDGSGQVILKSVCGKGGIVATVTDGKVGKEQVFQ